MDKHNQLNIFDDLAASAPSSALARKSDPKTSAIAAASMNEHVEDLQRRIVDAIHEYRDYGLTTDQIASVLCCARDSISPRMKPMELKGMVLRSEVVRANTSGRKAIVWKLPNQHEQ